MRINFADLTVRLLGASVVAALCVLGGAGTAHADEGVHTFSGTLSGTGSSAYSYHNDVLSLYNSNNTTMVGSTQIDGN